MRHHGVKIRNYLKSKYFEMINKTQAYNFRDNEKNKKGNKTNRYPHKKKTILVQHKIFKAKQPSKNKAIAKKSQTSKKGEQKNIGVLHIFLFVILIKIRTHTFDKRLQSCLISKS